MDFGKIFNKIVDVVKENIENAANPTSKPTTQPQPKPQPAATTHYEEKERTDSEWLAYFREILATEFSQYSIREKVAVTDVGGFATANVMTIGAPGTSTWTKQASLLNF